MTRTNNNVSGTADVSAKDLKNYLGRLRSGDFKGERKEGGKHGSGKPRWRTWSVVLVAQLVRESGRALSAALRCEEPAAAPSHYEQRLSFEAERAALTF